MMDRTALEVPVAAGQIPLWIKALYTLYVCVLVPVYWTSYGPSNFLWFSQIALLTTVVALWLESSLLASMMAVGVLLPELAWNVAFFARLIFGVSLGGPSGYMFDARLPLYVRSLSLFHVILPVLLIWMVRRLGYDRRAWLAQTLVAWLVLPISYLVSDPEENINWVFGPGRIQFRLPPLLYLALLMILFPLVVYLPTYWVLLKTVGPRAGGITFTFTKGHAITPDAKRP